MPVPPIRPCRITGAFGALLLLILNASGAEPGQRAEDVTVTTVPPVVYTAVQQAEMDARHAPPGAQSVRDNLTWMFHLVFESSAPTELRIEDATVAFTRNGVPLWQETYSRPYLESMEWIRGAYRHSTEYFLDRVMFGREEPTTPDLQAGAAISWVRIPFSQPWFALADHARFTFRLADPSNAVTTVTHEVKLHSRRQKTTFRLPFEGTWLVVKGSEFGPVTHRWTGINGLTTFGWDFMKVGPGHALYKGAGRSPRDRYSYDAQVLAAADGRVVHVRNDIPDHDVPPPRALLESDGDVFAGNLVVIDHGNGEFTLTCHLQPGSVRVEIGQRVMAGQVLGAVGEEGILHFNLMNGREWLDADGLPALFSDFERVPPVGEPRKIDTGSPVTGWMIRPTAGDRN
jgi:hypothetical protein